MRREETERVLRTMAEVAPAFGLVGSVVGLIGMLAGVADTEVILATLPIALTSTLYGIILSNFFLIPFAENIRERTHQELFLQKIIMEGVIAIESEIKPRILERKLKSFLTPSSRKSRLVSLSKIQEKFNIKPDSPILHHFRSKPRNSFKHKNTNFLQFTPSLKDRVINVPGIASTKGSVAISIFISL